MSGAPVRLQANVAAPCPLANQERWRAALAGMGRHPVSDIRIPFVSERIFGSFVGRALRGGGDCAAPYPIASTLRVVHPHQQCIFDIVRTGVYGAPVALY